MHNFKAGKLHSGSKSGPKVKNRKQAIAIMLSEKRAAQGGKKEYQPNKPDIKGKADRPEYRGDQKELRPTLAGLARG